MLPIGPKRSTSGTNSKHNHDPLPNSRLVGLGAFATRFAPPSLILSGLATPTLTLDKEPET